MRASPLLAGPAMLCLAATLTAGCEADPEEEAGVEPIVIGANIELSGLLPEVGLSSRRAAELFVRERNDAGGVALGDDQRPWTLMVRDNRNEVDAAAAVAGTLILESDALALLGPNPSTLAIPAGGLADELETPMVSPWSTNPATTQDRDWVFRAPFVDTYQGPVLVDFATAQYAATTACILHEEGDAASSGIAETFRAAWRALHGDSSVLADESLVSSDTSFSAQLTVIRDSGCEVLFAPLYAPDVVRTVTEAQMLGLTAPILGSDAWVTAGLLEACGAACDGYYFSAHYVATGATGVTKAFIDLYEATYGETPDDVAALTWDALLVIEQGLTNCGEITGDLALDRACLRDGIAMIVDLPGVTGAITYRDTGDPEKCVVIGQIQSGAFVAVDEVCP